MRALVELIRKIKYMKVISVVSCSGAHVGVLVRVARRRYLGPQL